MEEITTVLDGLEYAFFKLVKPVEYLPKEVDILMEVRHMPRAVERFRKLGYGAA